jgi:hypothetical protein
MPDTKMFTLTQADMDLLNSIPVDSDFVHIWKVLAEKPHFKVNTIAWAGSDNDPYIYAEPEDTKT